MGARGTDCTAYFSTAVNYARKMGVELTPVRTLGDRQLDPFGVSRFRAYLASLALSSLNYIMQTFHNQITSLLA